MLYTVKESLGNIGYMDGFVNTDNKNEDIAAAAEMFLTTLYLVNPMTALNALMYMLYRNISSTGASRKCTRPPITAAAQ